MTNSLDIDDVFTLLVQVGRHSGDGLPDGSTGAGILCFAAGKDEAIAVRETVAVLKTAEMAPLDVTSYGSFADRIKNGEEISEEEKDLIGGHVHVEPGVGEFLVAHAFDPELGRHIPIAGRSRYSDEPTDRLGIIQGIWPDWQHGVDQVIIRH